ncbi:MAG: metalloregulator ArsR/SmtB family transcription factor [Planctomycetes bacterium]|nr:metalloregulator ArsR/SmtB family transcription factor [Planctomycetota bacterium]
MASDLPKLLKMFADTCRLRLLALLDEEELSVQELGKITGLGQSRVSRHLALLREAEVVQDRREGAFTYYRFARETSHEDGTDEDGRTPETNGAELPRGLWRHVRDAFRALPVAERDRKGLARIREVRRERSRRTHDRLAGAWRVVGEDLERGTLRAEALAAMAAKDLVVADLGCGAGFFASYLAPRARRVIAVDHSDAMLEEAKRASAGAGEIEFRRGELDALPLAAGESDAAFANLVLHHVPEFAPVVGEIGRILKPGGVAVITEFLPHREEWMREELGDSRLGVEPDELAAAFRRGPFGEVELLPVEDRYRMKNAGGRVARLQLFMIRARRARPGSSSSNETGAPAARAARRPPKRRSH